MYLLVFLRPRKRCFRPLERPLKRAIIVLFSKTLLCPQHTKKTLGTCSDKYRDFQTENKEHRENQRKI